MKYFIHTIYHISNVNATTLQPYSVISPVSISLSAPGKETLVVNLVKNQGVSEQIKQWINEGQPVIEGYFYSLNPILDWFILSPYLNDTIIEHPYIKNIQDIMDGHNINITEVSPFSPNRPTSENYMVLYYQIKSKIDGK